MKKRFKIDALFLFNVFILLGVVFLLLSFNNLSERSSDADLLTFSSIKHLRYAVISYAAAFMCACIYGFKRNEKINKLEQEIIELKKKS